MGIALQPAAAAGEWIDVFLLPYAFTIAKA
jgi:hypothetical protein